MGGKWRKTLFLEIKQEKYILNFSEKLDSKFYIEGNK